MDKELQQCDVRGWIPGPKEEKKSFFQRIDALDDFFANPPSDVDWFLTDRDWSEAKKLTKHFYDFSPDWIVAHYSNRNLSFFQGAATWITEKEGLRIPLVQLKKSFETGRLHKIYTRSEVLAHEAVHAARMQFDQPLFEEIFAYKTSRSSLRRWLGPMFQRSWEASMFIAFLLIPIGIEITKFFPIDLQGLKWLSLLPALYIGFLLTRLCFLQVILSLACRRLKTWLQTPKKALAAAFRLTDREIFRFATQKKEKVREYSEDPKSFRWKLLEENYFQ